MAPTQASSVFPRSATSRLKPEDLSLANPRNSSDHLIKIEWFADYAGHQILFAGRRMGRCAISGHEDHRQPWVTLANGSGRFPTVHLRHRQISKDQIKVTTGNFLDGLP